jgi:drug/metabolite transporter (DMT)-like permease
MLPAVRSRTTLVGMISLLLASLLWAFSFGLIKRFLPQLDPWWVAAVRLAIATVALAPWALRQAPPPGLRVRALALGSVQFGAMYVLYIASFGYLAAWQVALWTVLTPLLVVLLERARRRGAVVRPIAASLLAIAGALLAQGRWPQGDTLLGVLLVQGSNLCFAAGQLGYRDLARAAGAVGPDAAPARPGREAGLLGWMHLGATVLAGAGFVVAGDRTGASLDGAALPTLLYLGIAPTAVGFWLWNRGAARTGPAQLAVANNLKVPLAVLVAWLVFGESAPYERAALGLAVVVAALGVAAGVWPARGRGLWPGR